MLDADPVLKINIQLSNLRFSWVRPSLAGPELGARPAQEQKKTKKKNPVFSRREHEYHNTAWQSWLILSASFKVSSKASSRSACVIWTMKGPGLLMLRAHHNKC